MKKNEIQPAILKIAKGLARNPKQGFCSLPITDSDLPGASLYYHCLTTLDNLSCVAITNSTYRHNFAKKLCNDTLLHFRDFFSVNPDEYLVVREDT